jgi:hypothetical protein
MPAIPEWIPRLPEIIGSFEALSTMVLDQEIFVHVFKVGRRRAFQLLHEFGATQTYRGLAADRVKVLERLREMKDDFDLEEARRARLAEDLEKARRLAPARKVRIRTVPDVWLRVMAGLPSTVHLKPGELRIEFFGAEDLLSQLFEFAQAVTNDYAEFEASCEEPEMRAKRVPRKAKNVA